MAGIGNNRVKPNYFENQLYICERALRNGNYIFSKANTEILINHYKGMLKRK